MNTVARFLRLDFIPTSIDAGLLVLRLWLGLSLLSLHGWAKLTGFQTMAEKFPDPLKLGGTFSLSLAILAEVLAALLVAIGLFTRLAALICVILLAVAFTIVHQMALKGPGNGELAFIYMAGFLALFLAGPGRFAIDASARSSRRGQ